MCIYVLMYVHISKNNFLRIPRISNFPPRRQAPGAAVQRQLTVSAPASCLLKVVTRISQKEEKDNRTKKNLLCKTNQESEQAIAANRRDRLLAAATTYYIQLHIRTFDSASSSDYAKFAYKLIKTTRELLQETNKDVS